MKLFYIINANLPNKMAHGSHVIKMCQAFSKQGVDVTLVLPNKPNNIKDDIFSYYNIDKSFKIIKLPTLSFLPRWVPFNFILSAISFGVSSLVFFILQKGTVIIYCRGEMVLFLKLLPKRFKFFWETHIKPDSVKRYKKVFSKGRGIIVVTKYYRNELINDYKIAEDKIFYSPDAVDLAMFKNVHLTKNQLRDELNLPQDKKIITYAGKFKTMCQSKGVEDILVSFKNLEKKYSNIFLLLVGLEPNEKPLVEKLLSGCKNYKLVEYVPLERLIRYELASDILVMNYPDDFHYKYYMSPLKMFEYMATGNPIITTDLPCIRDVLNEKNSVLVKPNSPAGLTNGLETLLNDETLGRILSDKALYEVEKYTWNNRAKETKLFIQKMVENTSVK